MGLDLSPTILSDNHCRYNIGSTAHVFDTGWSVSVVGIRSYPDDASRGVSEYKENVGVCNSSTKSNWEKESYVEWVRYMFGLTGQYMRHCIGGSRQNDVHVSRSWVDSDKPVIKGNSSYCKRFLEGTSVFFQLVDPNGKLVATLQSIVSDGVIKDYWAGGNGGQWYGVQDSTPDEVHTDMMKEFCSSHPSMESLFESILGMGVESEVFGGTVIVGNKTLDKKSFDVGEILSSGKVECSVPTIVQKFPKITANVIDFTFDKVPELSSPAITAKKSILLSAPKLKSIGLLSSPDIDVRTSSVALTITVGSNGKLNLARCSKLVDLTIVFDGVEPKLEELRLPTGLKSLSWTGGDEFKVKTIYKPRIKTPGVVAGETHLIRKIIK